jgi:hypothetical protein
MTPDQWQPPYRYHIIEALQLIASREAQLEYQRNVPIAYVTDEIFCAWDDFYDESHVHEEWFLASFSAEERQALAAFDALLIEVASCIEGEPDIEDFVLTPEWAKMSQAAAATLEILQQGEDTPA